jgi:Tol biopolymer transport system component
VAGRAALLVVIIAAVSFVVSRSAYGPAGLGAAGEARFISALDGYETQPALSPNGDMVAFAWAATGVRTRRIMVMPITGGTPRALTDGVHDDSQPAWSPDGREVAFLRREAGDSTFAIMTAPVIGGGVPRKLLSTRSSYGLDWSPTGDFLWLTSIVQTLGHSTGSSCSRWPTAQRGN